MFLEKDFIKNFLFFPKPTNLKIINFEKFYKLYFELLKPKTRFFNNNYSVFFKKLVFLWFDLNNIGILKEKNHIVLNVFNRLRIDDEDGLISNFNIFNKNDFLLLNSVKEDKINDITKALPKLQNLFEMTFPEKSLIISKNFIFFSSSKLNNICFSLYSKRKSYNFDEKKNKYFNFVSFFSVLNFVHPEQFCYNFVDIYIKKYSYHKSLIFSLFKTQKMIVNNLEKVYKSQGIKLNVSNFEVLSRLLCNRVKIIVSSDIPFFIEETINFDLFKDLIKVFQKFNLCPPLALPKIESASSVTKNQDSFLSSISFQNTSAVIVNAVINSKKDWIANIKSELILNKTQTKGTNFNL